MNIIIMFIIKEVSLTSLVAWGQERCRHCSDSEGTGADIRFPRLCLPVESLALNRSQNSTVENLIMAFKSIAHIQCRPNCFFLFQHFWFLICPFCLRVHELLLLRALQSPIRSLGRLPVGLGSLNKILCHTQKSRTHTHTLSQSATGPS